LFFGLNSPSRLPVLSAFPDENEFRRTDPLAKPDFGRMERERLSPATARVRSNPASLVRRDGAHPIVLRVVLYFGEAQRLEDRRHVHSKAAAQALL
jgi:hypothetical protein